MASSNRNSNYKIQAALAASSPPASEIKLQTRPLATLPPQIDFDHVTRTGELKISPTDKKQENDAIIKLRAGTKGYIRNPRSRSYDIIYNITPTAHFVGRVYPPVVASGTFGRIQLVNQNDKWYALKVQIQHNFYTVDELKKMLASEFEVAKKMELGLFCIDQAFLMQWVPGVDLYNYLQVKPTMPSAQRLRIAASIGRSVMRMHSTPYFVAHRDLKRANLILQNETVVPVDFGRGYQLSDVNSVVPNETTVHYQYRAPELYDEKSSTPICGIQADTYSTAIIEAELLGCYNRDLDKFKEEELLSSDAPRIIERENREFERNFPDKDVREKLLAYLRRKTAANPENRASLAEGCELYTDLAEQCASKTPLIKAIVSVAELLELIKQTSRMEALGFAPLDLPMFLSALKKADVVLLAEEAEHTVRDHAMVDRALMYQTVKVWENNVLVSRIQFTGINRQSQVFFTEHKSATIEQIISAIPAHDKASESSKNCVYICITQDGSGMKLPDGCDVLTFHPRDFLHNDVSMRNLMSSSSSLRQIGQFASKQSDVKPVENTTSSLGLGSMCTIL